MIGVALASPSLPRRTPMNPRTPPPPADRERLREQWLQQAAAVFDLYYDPEQAEPPVTFTQREERACALTRELAAFLLEQDLDQDPAARPPDEPAPACPKCGRPARRRTPPGEPPPRRQLTSAAGEVAFRRQQWHCQACRVSFFPAGPQAGAGDGGL
jgi:hypothetical protein